MNTDDTIKQTIRDAFATWDGAWNRGDMAGYLESYWESDSTLYISNGTVIEGKSAIAERFQSIFTSADDMGQLEITRMDIDLIGDYDAMVLGIFQLTRDNTVRRGAFTVHLRDFDGKWLIVSDHSSSA